VRGIDASRVGRHQRHDDSTTKGPNMITILLIILIVLFLTGGGYGYSRRGRL
jgi:hypothetical protein